MSDFDIYPEYSTDISKFITLSNVNGICIWNVKILYLRSSEIFILNNMVSIRIFNTQVK